MEIEEAIYARLKADAALGALVGERIFPGQAPTDAQRPYVIYEEAAQERVRTLTGYAGLNRWAMHLDFYAGTRAQAKAVRAKVSELLDGFRGDLGPSGEITVQGVFHDDQDSGTEQPIHGDETGEHRLSLDLSVWFRKN